jgi:hypothetical protein
MKPQSTPKNYSCTQKESFQRNNRRNQKRRDSVVGHLEATGLKKPFQVLFKFINSQWSLWLDLEEGRE